MSEWKKTKLEDCCRSISDGDHLPPPKTDSGVPFVTISDIRNNQFDLSNTRFVPEAYYEAIDPKRKIQKGDVLYSVVGSYGIPVFANESLKVAFQRHIAILRPSEEIEPRFLYYSMLNRDFFLKADAVAVGAAQRTITLSALRGLEIAMPPLPIQRRIAAILSDYDAAIANCRKQIALLEEAILRLYREWFADGKGEKKTIADISETIGGGTPSTSKAEYWDGDIPWVVPTDITRNSCLSLLSTEKCITKLGLEKSSAKMLPAKAILMTSRASVGYFGVADFPVCTNQGFISIVPHDEKMRWYLLFNLITRVEEIRAKAKGATFAEISKSSFRALDVVVPARAKLLSFDNFATGIMKSELALGQHIRTLTEARDRLLPKLMSGEVAV